MMSAEKKVNTINNDLLQEINLFKAKSIYDFLGIIAYYVLKNRDKDRISDFNEFCGTECAKRINAIVEMCCNNAALGYKCFIDIWIKQVEEYKVSFYVICKYTLTKFDAYYETNTKPAPLPEYTGPKNDLSLTNSLQVYNKPNESFQSSFLVKNHIRSGRNTITWDSTSPLNCLHSYLFVNTEDPGEKPIQTYRYTPSVVFSDEIRIACFSLSREKWFDFQLNSKHLNFSCSYSDEEKKGKITDLFKKSIILAHDKGCNIVLFPEMAFFPSLEDEIKGFLIKNEDIGRVVSLIFMGTKWDNGSNIGILLSGNGTELIRVYKQKPFLYHDKESEQDYVEFLTNVGNVLPVLDVEGLGRIAWYICRDYLEGVMISRYGRLDTTFSFVSAYSNSIIEMVNNASTDCLRGSIVMIGNRCTYDPCVNENKNQFNRGACITPAEKKDGKGCNKNLDCRNKCDCNDCLESSCGFICSINKELNVSIREIDD